jgi:hypothetical protein
VLARATMYNYSKQAYTTAALHQPSLPLTLRTLQRFLLLFIISYFTAHSLLLVITSCLINDAHCPSLESCSGKKQNARRVAWVLERRQSFDKLCARLQLNALHNVAYILRVLEKIANQRSASLVMLVYIYILHYPGNRITLKITSI